jgi:transposase InsO family protein
VKSYWTQWERLRLQNGVLSRRWESEDGLRVVWQTLLPAVYRPDFIRLLHSGVTGGHMGLTKTCEQVKARAYWIGWASDVRTELTKCNACAQYHMGNAPRQVGLQPMPVGEPWERLGIDITGPHPRSSRGNEYALTVVDHFSKWAEAYAIPNHKAMTVARKLVNELFTRFGTPLQILSDQGTEFGSQLMNEIYSWLDIDKIRTSPYRPQTNGATERLHRTINQMLAKCIAHNQRDWDQRLPFVMAAYRASVHESTGYSPNYLILGREVYAPLDVVLGVPEEEETQWRSTDDFVAERQRICRESYTCARDTLQKCAQRRKVYYDVRVKPKTFSVGSWVWYFTPRKYVGKSAKWTKNYTGPYLIVRVIPPAVAVIQKSKRARLLTVHFDKLKLCRGNTPAAWRFPDDVHVADEPTAGPSLESIEDSLISVHDIDASSIVSPDRSPMFELKLNNETQSPRPDSPPKRLHRPDRVRCRPKKLADFVLHVDRSNNMLFDRHPDPVGSVRGVRRVTSTTSRDDLADADTVIPDTPEEGLDRHRTIIPCSSRKIDPTIEDVIPTWKLPTGGLNWGQLQKDAVDASNAINSIPGTMIAYVASDLMETTLPHLPHPLRQFAILIAATSRAEEAKRAASVILAVTTNPEDQVLTRTMKTELLETSRGLVYAPNRSPEVGVQSNPLGPINKRRMAYGSTSSSGSSSDFPGLGDPVMLPPQLGSPENMEWTASAEDLLASTAFEDPLLSDVLSIVAREVGLEPVNSDVYPTSGHAEPILNALPIPFPARDPEPSPPVLHSKATLPDEEKEPEMQPPTPTMDEPIGQDIGPRPPPESTSEKPMGPGPKQPKLQSQSGERDGDVAQVISDDDETSQPPVSRKVAKNKQRGRPTPTLSSSPKVGDAAKKSSNVVSSGKRMPVAHPPASASDTITSYCTTASRPSPKVGDAAKKSSKAVSSGKRMPVAHPPASASDTTTSRRTTGSRSPSAKERDKSVPEPLHEYMLSSGHDRPRLFSPLRQPSTSTTSAHPHPSVDVGRELAPSSDQRRLSDLAVTYRARGTEPDRQPHRAHDSHEGDRRERRDNSHHSSRERLLSDFETKMRDNRR